MIFIEYILVYNTRDRG